MRILITGGAGYIGTQTVEELAKDPKVSEIVVYDNLSHGRHGLFFGDRIQRAKIRFIRGELLDTRTLGKALVGIDVVLHFAAKVSTPFALGDPHSFEQVNHWGTAELSYLLEESDVRRVVYLSSASVYGLSDGIRSLADKPEPNTWYGTSKLRGEQMMLRLQNKMDVLVLRCANVYGYSPSMRFDAVINRFVREAHFEQKITVEGNGAQKRPFVHIDRVGKILAYAAMNTTSSNMFHVVDDNISIWQIAEHLKDVYSDLEMIFVEQDIPRASLEIEASPELDFISRAPFQENITAFFGRIRFS
jgi:UDP-glucose 4-epimerase